MTGWRDDHEGDIHVVTQGNSKQAGETCQSNHLCGHVVRWQAETWQSSEITAGEMAGLQRAVKKPTRKQQDMGRSHAATGS